MKNTKNQKNLIILLTLVLIFTLLWVVSNVYHNYINSTIELPLVEDINPIESTFDTKTIEEIKTRNRVEVSNDILTIIEEVQVDNETTLPSTQIENEAEFEATTQSGEFEL